MNLKAATFRLRWDPTDLFQGAFNNQPYASFYTREEAFRWGSVLQRIGATGVKVEQYKGRSPPLLVELRSFLCDCFERKHPNIVVLETTSHTLIVLQLAKEVGVKVPKNDPMRTRSCE